MGKGKGKEKGKGKGKGKGGVKGGGDSDSSDSAPEIAVGKGKGKEKGKGKGRGKGKGKEVVMVSDSESSDSDMPISSTGVRRGQVAPESSDSDSKVPVSSTGVKRGRAAPDPGAPSGKRRKKISRSPYVGWSGGGPGDQGSLPLRIVTQVRTVLDYVKGSAHRPRNWMRSFPLIRGGDAGPGELILLIVTPETKAEASHKA